MPLTTLAVENAKPRDKPYILTDGNGLHLVVNPNGKKLWRLRYRFTGKQNMLSLGVYPVIGLAAARSRRDDAHKLIADDVDPSHQRKLDQIARGVASKTTFGGIVEEHLEILKEDRAAVSTISKNRWLLQDLAAPLTKRPITAITPAEILLVLQRVEKTGRRETARRLRGAIGTIFRRAITTLRATNDPTYALRGALRPPIVQHRAAIIDERELGALMVSIDEYDGWPTVRAALQLIGLTMTRPIEIRLMRRSEVNWPKATWSIPAERMKMRRPHEVPLSKQGTTALQTLFVPASVSLGCLYGLIAIIDGKPSYLFFPGIEADCAHRADRRQRHRAIFDRQEICCLPRHRRARFASVALWISEFLCPLHHHDGSPSSTA